MGWYRFVVGCSCLSTELQPDISVFQKDESVITSYIRLLNETVYPCLPFKILTSYQENSKYLQVRVRYTGMC